MTNGSSAVSLDRYDEYGIPGTSSTGTVTNTGRFQYTGQIYIPELGMYDYKARIYSPRLGRFLQTDPVGYEGGINIYEYVGDDPINNEDPSGNIVIWRDQYAGMERAAALKYLAKSPTWSSELRQAGRADSVIQINAGYLFANHTYSDNSITWNPGLGLETRSGDLMSAAVTLGHELDHALRQATDLKTYLHDEGTKTATGTLNEDKATATSNAIAGELGEPTQKNYLDAVAEPPVSSVSFSQHVQDNQKPDPDGCSDVQCK
jgi:RHS repeat-associated protein